MLLLDSKDISGGPARLNIPSGQYAGFAIVIEGVTGAGAAPVVADLGYLKIYLDKSPICNVSIEQLQIVNNIDGGFPVSTIGAAGGNPIQIFAFYPASFAKDGNVFDIAASDNAFATVDLSGYAAAEWGSGTVALYGVPQVGRQMYVPQLYTMIPNLAASQVQPLELKYGNITALYFATLTNLARVMVKRDRETPVEVPVNPALWFSNYENRHEAAYATGFKVDIARSGSIQEAVNKTLTLTLTAGAGGAANPVVMVLANAYTPTQMVRSETMLSARAEHVLKNNAGSEAQQVASQIMRSAV